MLSNMQEESFNVDAFNERDRSGILGRMTDVLSNSMATSQIAIGKSLSNLVGDPSLGRKVDILSSSDDGAEEFFRVNVAGVSHWLWFLSFSFYLQPASHQMIFIILAR